MKINLIEKKNKIISKKFSKFISTKSRVERIFNFLWFLYRKNNKEVIINN